MTNWKRVAGLSIITTMSSVVVLLFWMKAVAEGDDPATALLVIIGSIGGLIGVAGLFVLGIELLIEGSER